MNLDVVSLMENKSHMKSIIWGTSQDKISMQVDIPDFNMANHIIQSRDSGGITLETSSTKTRMDLRIGQSNKDLTYSRGLLSWRRP